MIWRLYIYMIVTLAAFPASAQLMHGVTDALSGGGSPIITGADLLLEDGASFLLLEDGVSKLCLESGC